VFDVGQITTSRVGSDPELPGSDATRAGDRDGAPTSFHAIVDELAADEQADRDAVARKNAGDDEKTDPNGVAAPVAADAPVAPVPPATPAGEAGAATGDANQQSIQPVEGSLVPVFIRLKAELQKAAAGTGGDQAKTDSAMMSAAANLAAEIEGAIDSAAAPGDSAFSDNSSDNSDRDGAEVALADLAKNLPASIAVSPTANTASTEDAKSSAANLLRAVFEGGRQTSSSAGATKSATEALLQSLTTAISRSAGSAASPTGSVFMLPPGAHTTLGPASILQSAAAAHGLTGPEIETPAATTAAQIVQAIRLQWSQGGGEAHIRLQPEHFGEMTVSVKVDQGIVTARLQAEQPVAREWLQANQAQLRQALSTHNLTLERLEIAEPPAETRHDERRDEASSQESRDDRWQRRPRRRDTGELFEIVA